MVGLWCLESEVREDSWKKVVSMVREREGGALVRGYCLSMHVCMTRSLMQMYALRSMVKTNRYVG